MSANPQSQAGAQAAWMFVAVGGRHCPPVCPHVRAVNVSVPMLRAPSQESRCDANVEVAIKMILELSEINDCLQ